MKSFGIKRDEKDPRWAKFIEWWNVSFFESGFTMPPQLEWVYYGVSKCSLLTYSDYPYIFDRIITLDEWEAEFMNKLAGREYDERLFNEFQKFGFQKVGTATVVHFLNHRYAKQDRIAEIKEQIEKLNNELKELEK